MRTLNSAAAIAIGMALAASTLAARTGPTPRPHSHSSPAAITLLLAHRTDLGLTEAQASQLAALDPARRPVVQNEIIGFDRVPGKAGVPRYRGVSGAPNTVAAQQERVVIVGLDRVPGKAGVPVYRKEAIPDQPDQALSAITETRITGLDRVPGKSVPTVERVIRPAPSIACPLTMLSSEQMAKAHLLLAEADLL